MSRIISALVIGVLVACLWWNFFFHRQATLPVSLEIGTACHGGPPLTAGSQPDDDIGVDQFLHLHRSCRQEAPTLEVLDIEYHVLCQRTQDETYRLREVARNRAEHYIIHHRLDSLTEEAMAGHFRQQPAHTIERHLPDFIGYSLCQLLLLWWLVWRGSYALRGAARRQARTFCWHTLALAWFVYGAIFFYYHPWPDNPLYPILLGSVFVALLASLLRAWGAEFVKLANLLL